MSRTVCRSRAHSARIWTRLSVATLATSALVAACGGTETNPGGRPTGGSTSAQRTGETKCLSAVCGAGQYCEGGAICVPGCTSSANCLAGTECVDVDDFTHVGTCESGTSQPPPPPPPPPPKRDATCDGYATHAKECGLLASEAEAIRQSCDQMDAQTKTALVSCNASETCSELMGCSGVQCFEDEHCPPAKPDCVLRTEVVDPLTDQPYHCR